MSFEQEATWQQVLRITITNIATIAYSFCAPFLQNHPCQKSLKLLPALGENCRVLILAVEQKLWLEIKLTITKLIDFQMGPLCSDTTSGRSQTNVISLCKSTTLLDYF